MKGTNLSVTLAMRLMPPMITTRTPTQIASTMPKMTPEGLPPRKPSSPPVTAYLREGLVGLERVATAQRAEDAEDGEGSGEELAQDGHALLGEPAREVEHRAACTVLSAFSRRYFTPKMHSANFVVIDRKPATITRTSRRDRRCSWQPRHRRCCRGRRCPTPPWRAPGSETPSPPRRAGCTRP